MMIPPEVIERMKREREEQERPALQIPLYTPEECDGCRFEDEEPTETKRIIVIDL